MSTSAVRRPAVAGYYYPADPESLRREIDRLTSGHEAPSMPALAAVLPHGSYRHAGRVIGSTLARLAIPRRVILLGPSHTGSWMPWSLMAGGAYRTPLGEVPVDELLADALRARCPFLDTDAWSQRGEHALEVLVPFLQRRGPADLRIVPIVLGTEDRAQFSQLARALAQVIRMCEEPVLMIASTDLSHYAPLAEADAQDQRLLDWLCRLDGAGLLDAVRESGIVMCGDGPAAIVLDAAKALGATQATVAARGTSLEGGGDPHAVTGYAGVIIQ